MRLTYYYVIFITAIHALLVVVSYRRMRKSIAPYLTSMRDRLALFPGCTSVTFSLEEYIPEGFTSDGFAATKYAGKLLGEEIFVFAAFYDFRDNNGIRIRVAATAQCSLFQKEEFVISIGSTNLSLEWADILQGNCRGYYARCKFAEFDLSSVVYNGSYENTTTLNYKGRSVTIPLTERSTTYEESRTTGFIFIEWSKRNGVKHFIFPVRSVSRTVLALFQHYIDEGTMTLMPLPLLPHTDDLDPNDFSYFSSQFLAALMCTFWSNSKYTLMHDMDDMLFARNDTLWNLLESYMGAEDDRIAALHFKHHLLALGSLPDQRISSADFLSPAELSKVSIYSNQRLPKYAIRTLHARLPSVHYMLRTFNKKKTGVLDTSSGLYLHYRISAFHQNASKLLFPDAQLFANATQASLDMTRTLQSIFPQLPQYYAPMMYHLKGNCVQRNGCLHPTNKVCDAELRQIDDWLYMLPTERNHFTVL